MGIEDAIREQYDDASNLDARIALHRDFSIAEVPWYPWVHARIGSLEGLRALEVGCGSGKVWQGVEQVGELTLLDRSPGMVDTALTVVPAARGVCSDLLRMPFYDGEFDVVIANHVLYHVADLYPALAEIRRVMAPGARFFAATNGADHMRELEDASIECFGIGAWRPEISPGDFWLETGDDLLPSFFPYVTRHLYEDGLRVTEVEPLLAYVVSMLVPEDRLRTAPHAAHFRSFVKRRMDESGGAFHVTKASGLFECRKPREGEAKRRHAARVILIDESDRVFLFHGRNLEKTRTFWVMPGGGLDDGESLVDGLRRELREETGIEVEADFDAGPPVWTRMHTFPWTDGLTEQHETYFVVRVRSEQVTAPLGDDYTFEHRWWTLAEIQLSEERFVPRRLARHLPAILSGEVPAAPIDVGP